MAAQASLSTPLELSVECRHLIDCDRMSKSDPICTLFVLSSAGKWQELARTERIMDNLNPKFVTPLKIEYRFEEVQKLRFLVTDDDGSGKQADFLGELHCQLSEIVGSSGQSMCRDLMDEGGKTKHRKRGQIIIKSEEVLQNKQVLTLQLFGSKLKKMDLFGKSDPYFVINRSREDGSYIPVVKSSVLKNTLNPVWPVMQIPMSRLCGNDYFRPLNIEVFDWDKGSEHDLIGTASLNVQDILDKKNFDLEIVDKKGKKKSGRGTVSVRSSVVEEIPTFLDYLAGGCELNLMISVDFTQSNGDVNNPTSLHYYTEAQQNQYERAISAIGAILQDYDSDKLFPSFGFGGKLPGGQISHCFPLNGNSENPYCSGVDGVLAAYKDALRNVALWGPTLFSPSLTALRNYAQQYTSQDNQKYYILLILTDGVITDMDDTINNIVSMTDLPVSVVIVGIGPADFTAMEILDGDDGVLKDSHGKAAARDIVQFVPLRDFVHAHPAKLAESVLAEIPGQLLSYMKSKGYKPNPRIVTGPPPPYDPEE